MELGIGQIADHSRDEGVTLDNRDVFVIFLTFLHKDLYNGSHNDLNNELYNNFQDETSEMTCILTLIMTFIINDDTYMSNNFQVALQND